jgi:hypothetical protein
MKLMNNQVKKLPYELVNLILEYDGTIKYKYKKKDGTDYHKYVNIIHKNDTRYDVIRPSISKKLDIIQHAYTSSIDKECFRFKFSFNKIPDLELCYDFNWLVTDIFMISKRRSFVNVGQGDLSEVLIYT